jgi:uracil-DNA glycosylase family 4
VDGNSNDAARQLKEHVKRLQDAGVEWVAAPDRSKSPPAASVSLFDQTVAPAEPVFPAPAADRRLALAVLVQEVQACQRCPELASTRTQTVFGVGPLDAELCFIGEAPGADEDRRGEPFVGAAGQLLNKIIGACGMKREEVYICNILRCRPPGNRTPRAEEAANCHGFLERTLALVRPKFICCLGAVAATYLLQTTSSIGKMRRRFYEYDGIPVVCTYHPSYLLRNESPEPRRLVWEDMKMLLERMGKPIPPVRRSGE